MRLRPNTQEANRKSSFKANALAAIAIAAFSTAGWFMADPLKDGKRHSVESNEQILHSLDSDWTKLADRMEDISRNTKNPELVIKRRNTDITGGTGPGAETTVLTIKDGIYSQTSPYGFTATLVVPTKSFEPEAVQFQSSFSINFQGEPPIGLPFKKYIGSSSTQLAPNSFYFLMDKGSAEEWTITLESNISTPGLTQLPEKSNRAIDPAKIAPLVEVLSSDIDYLLTESNLVPGSSVNSEVPS